MCWGAGCWLLPAGCFLLAASPLAGTRARACLCWCSMVRGAAGGEMQTWMSPLQVAALPAGLPRQCCCSACDVPPALEVCTSSNSCTFVCVTLAVCVPVPAPAVQVAAADPNARYALGSVLNHVLLHQTIIGEEALLQLAKIGETPDLVVRVV